MEFHENKAKAPFIGFVQLWQAVEGLVAANAGPTGVTADE